MRNDSLFGKRLAEHHGLHRAQLACPAVGAGVVEHRKQVHSFAVEVERFLPHAVGGRDSRRTIPVEKLSHAIRGTNQAASCGLLLPLNICNAANNRLPHNSRLSIKYSIKLAKASPPRTRTREAVLSPPRAAAAQCAAA